MTSACSLYDERVVERSLLSRFRMKLLPNAAHEVSTELQCLIFGLRCEAVRNGQAREASSKSAATVAIEQVRYLHPSRLKNVPFKDGDGVSTVLANLHLSWA